MHQLTFPLFYCQKLSVASAWMTIFKVSVHRVSESSVPVFSSLSGLLVISKLIEETFENQRDLGPVHTNLDKKIYGSKNVQIQVDMTLMSWVSLPFCLRLS